MPPPRLIRTARLLLREPHPDDAPVLFASAFSQAEVLRHLGLRPHADANQTRQRLSMEIHRWLKHSGWLWIVARPSPLQPNGEALGQIELTPMSQPGSEAHHLRLGYLLGRPHWGQGVMREAVAAVVQVAWSMPAVWRVDALCDVDNPASARVLEAAGLCREGRLARAVLHPNASPQPRDAWLYAVTRPNTGTFSVQTPSTA